MKHNPLKLAEFCEMSYKNKSSNEEWQRRVREYFAKLPDYSDLAFFIDEKTFTQAFAVEYRSVCLIVFPGTEDLYDVITDCRAKFTVFGNKRYHSGVWDAFCSLKDNIQAHIKESEAKEIVTIGHSLGGGIAKVAAVEIPGVVECFTFGAPPVSDITLPLPAGLKIYQFINEADLVPRCMAVGTLWAPQVMQFFDQVKKDSAGKGIWTEISEFFIKVLDFIDDDLKEYSLVGDVFVLDDAGVAFTLKEPAKLVDILSIATTADRLLGIKHHFMKIYRERLNTQYGNSPMVLSDDKDYAPVNPKY